MKRPLLLALLLISANSAGCAGEAAGNPNGGNAGGASGGFGGSTAGHGGGSALGSGGLGGLGGEAASAGRVGSGGASVSNAGSSTDACPAWPRARLMPHVGAFFYGPDPGPCSDTLKFGSGGAFATTTYRYNYQAGKLLSLQEGSSATPSTTYSYDAQGLLQSATSSGGPEVFEFGADYLLDTTTESNGTIQQVRYALSPTGYPLTFSVGVTNAPTKTGSYTYDNCRLVARTLLGADGVVAEQLRYTYDGVGHVLSRLASDTTGDTYDYACWN